MATHESSLRGNGGLQSSTEALCTRAQLGDEEARAALFDAAVEKARLFVRLRLGPRLRTRLDSQDVLQEAFIEAHRAFDRFEYRGSGSFTRWLCRLIENRIRGLADHYDAKKRQPPGEMARVSQVAGRLAQATLDPAKQVQQQETHRRLVEGVDNLEADQREVLLLRFFQDRSITEIATLTECSTSTVRRLMGRAALALGEHLEQAP